MIKIGSILGEGGPRLLTDKEISMIAGKVTSALLSVSKAIDEPDKIEGLTYDSTIVDDIIEEAKEEEASPDWWGEYVADPFTPNEEDYAMEFIEVDTS
jgi:hypothetical protein